MYKNTFYNVSLNRKENSCAALAVGRAGKNKAVDLTLINALFVQAFCYHVSKNIMLTKKAVYCGSSWKILRMGPQNRGKKNFYAKGQLSELFALVVLQLYKQF